MDDFDSEKVKFDFKNLKENNISWWTRVLLRFWPAKGMMRLAQEKGLNPELMEKANDLFFRVKRVDIIPLTSGKRGFQIILDKSAALYFYQDGDHFVFDGSEVGEYESGNVTVFDHLR